MAKYKVLSLLWSPSRGEYIEPGAVVELDDEIGGVLMGKGVVEPAKFWKKKPASRSKKTEVEGNGTDD